MRNIILQAAIASSRRRRPPSSYLFSDDVEYADNAAANTVGGWTLTGSPVFGYATSPAPLDGSYSLSISGFGGDAATTTAFTASPETWVYFMFRDSSLSSQQTVVRLLDSVGTTAKCLVNTNGSLTIQAGSGGGDQTSAAGVITAGATYHIWLHFTATASPNPPALEVYVSDTAVRGVAAPVVTQTGGVTTGGQALKVKFGTVSSGVVLIWDRLRVSATEIGDNPL
jgi:hypothetical protein